MIKQLHIQNYALIEDLNLSLKSGFSIITGETGSGKSIVLGALGLLTGNRAEVSVVRGSAKKCVIEGFFDIGSYGLEDFFEANELEYEPETIVRREISSQGKSRAFVNDSPVTLNVLKELGGFLIDVHSQHANALLAQPSFFFSLLDNYAGQTEQVLAYKTSFQSLQKKRSELKLIIEKRDQEQLNLEFNQFQLNELKSVGLKIGEQEDLEGEFELLNNAEEIKVLANDATQKLSYQSDSALDLVRESLNALNRLAGINEQFEELKNRLETCQIELKDIAEELEQSTRNLSSDAARLQEIDDRLGLLFSMVKKHNVASVEQLLEKQTELELQVALVEGGEEVIEELNKEIRALEKELKGGAKEISKNRLKSAENIQKEVAEDLKGMGIPFGNLHFEFAQVELNSNGMDEIQVLFSANKGKSPQLMAKSASGGELSRVMLSLKRILAQRKSLPTIVFDEIDTGVSGEVANKMAEIMQRMSEGMQVLSITHLPQIAAKAHQHYKVTKSHEGTETTSFMVELNKSQRVEEIAQMLSGAKITEAALENAKALLG